MATKKKVITTRKKKVDPPQPRLKKVTLLLSDGTKRTCSPAQGGQGALVLFFIRVTKDGRERQDTMVAQASTGQQVIDGVTHFLEDNPDLVKGILLQKLLSRR